MAMAEPIPSISYPRIESIVASLVSSHKLILGLPELCLNGISENWLLRHCGAVHWARLADALGVRPEQVFDKQGDRLYASFYRVNMEGALTGFGEGDEVEVDCDLRRLSPLRYKSEQTIRNLSRGRCLRMTMCSTFVKRRARNNNIHLVFSEPVTSAQCIQKSDCANARICRDSAKQAKHSDSSNEFTYDPSPIADFNGVGLFYFAQYQAALDSAEWQLHRDPAMVNCGTTQRTISYFGNLNIGDRLKICFSNVDLSRCAIAHVAAVYRESDNFLVAEAVTRKEPQTSGE